MWYNIAALLGNETAQEFKKTLTKEMTSSEIEKAKKLSKLCLYSNYENCE